MNKKGIFNAYILIFVILSVSLGIYLASEISADEIKILGDSQVFLLDSYSAAEVDLFNYEQELKYNFKDFIVDLAAKGGVLNQNDGNYNYWQKGNKKCYPSLEKIKENLGKLISDYKTEVDDSEILIYYNETYSFSDNKTEIKYYFTPILNFKYNYSLNEFLNKINEIERVVDICESDIFCWNVESKYNFNIEQKGDDLILSIDCPKIKDVFGEKEIIFKGAIDFGFNPLIDDFECN